MYIYLIQIGKTIIMDKKSNIQNIFDANTDYKTILPLQQKRTITFVNAFVNETVTFLNKFAQSCESRLIQCESRMHKIEAALLILESRLSSVPDHTLTSSESKELLADVVDIDLPLPDINVHTDPTNDETKEIVLKSYNDPKYVKFFKMVQVGVPPTAVKLKMASEGIDPNILEQGKSNFS